MRRYPDLVTFQAPTEARASSGQVTYTYANIEGLTDLPARVVPVIEEDGTDRMVLTTDLWEIIVQGDRAIEVNMAALTTRGVMDVVRVARPTTTRQRTLATIVRAQLVAA